MKINKIYIILLLLFVQVGFGQNKSKEIAGQILEQSTSVDAVNIINNTTQVSAVSDANGMFRLLSKKEMSWFFPL